MTTAMLLSNPERTHLPHILSTIKEIEEKEMPVVKGDSIGSRKVASETRISDYENLIVAHYLDELKKQPPYTRKTHQAPLSPYAQKLPHTNIVLTAPQVKALIEKQKIAVKQLRKPRSRPQSALTYSQVQGEQFDVYLPQKPKVDAKFIADPDKWDPATPRPEEAKKKRPQSAPMGSSPNRRRPMSAYKYHQRSHRPLSAHRPSSAKSCTSSKAGGTGRKQRLYQRQPHTIVVTAYKNGSRERCCKVAAPNLKLLLEMCTEKLGLPLAGRRIFTNTGGEIYDGHEVERGTEVFISTGEDFKDPDASTKLHNTLSRGVTWRMNGLVLPDQGRKKNTKPVLSKRFNQSIERKTVRVLVFKNGKHTDGVEVVADPKQWPLALDKMGDKLNLRSPVRFLYDCLGNVIISLDQKWDGTEVVSAGDMPVLDSCLQTVATSLLHGPLWASCGEGFNPLGAKCYVQDLLAQIRQRVRNENAYLQQLKKSRDGDNEGVTVVAILSMTDIEREENIRNVGKEISEFNAVKEKLEAQVGEIEPLIVEMAMSNGYTLKHIKEIDASDRLVGIRGINLLVYKNGCDQNPYRIFFNLTDAGKRSNSKAEVMQKLLDHIAANCHQLREEGNVKGLISRKWKLFDASGREIVDVNELIPQEQVANDEDVEKEVWLSFGENYKSPFTLCLQASFDKIIGLSVIRSTKPARTVPKPAKIVPPSLTSKKHKTKNQKKVEKVRMFGVDSGDDDEYDDDFSEDSDSDESSDEEPRVHTPVIMEEKVIAVREQLCLDEVVGRERSSYWRATVGLPENYVLHRVDVSRPDQAMNISPDTEIDPSFVHFLQCKEDSHLLVYPELSVASKKPKGFRGLWPAECQIWVFTQEGCIHMKAFPQIVLTVTETFVKMELPSCTIVEGYEVGLRKRLYNSANQCWKFGNDGLIRCESHPELALTCLGGVFDNADSVTKNVGDDLPAGHRFFLSICEQLPRKDAKYQRFAIKQERFDNLGQWKHSTVENPEWNKLAYSWPVDRNGEWNEKFDWPMEGSIIAFAPPISNPRKTTVSSAIRLAVVRNGDKDTAQPQLIVGPDLSNMQKDLGNKSRSHGNQRHQHQHGHHDDVPDSVSDGQHLHCTDMSLDNLEFMLFLEHCTNMLSLPFAARRLFDMNGREHFTLRELERDALVYVSCGEAWSDPQLSKAEQQRRFLLGNLAADIAQIRQFVALRDPADLVLEVDGGLNPNSRLVVNKNSLSNEESEASNQSEAHNDVAMDDDEIERKQLLEEMVEHGVTTAHERAHQRSQKRMETLKWPWEQLVSGSMDDDLDKADQCDKGMGDRKMKSKSASPAFSRYHLQKFIYADGYLACMDKQDLVLGVPESEGRIQDVLIMRKKPDDIFQRWIIDSTGLIRAKHNPKMVLTVSVPTNTRSGDESLMLSYASSPVMLAQVKNTQFSRANQKFFFDQETGLIHAFYTDFLDKEITAANKVNICTYAVIGETELDQPGYEVEYPVAKREVQKLIVCASCARAMRGRFKTTKISKNVDFACAMGTAHEKGIKQVGSFQCLNGKVDLSSFEAQHTLELWEDHYKRLRKKRSVRQIAKEIAAASCPRTVKTIIYKNGEGRSRKGEIIYGSSVHGLLTQATLRVYGMSFAARRLYTVDGTIVMDVDDLIAWAVDEYMIQAKLKKLRKQDGTRETKNDGDASVATATQPPEPPASDSTVGSGPIEVRKLMKSPATPRYEEEGDTDDSHHFLEEDVGERNEVDEEKGNGDEDQPEEESEEDEFVTEHARKLAELAEVQVKMPSLDEILRQPIELWASCGEKFKKPANVSVRLERKKRERLERADVALDLDVEKHKLRHMQGRRFDEMYPGDYISTNDPDRPVVLEGTWHEPTPREQDQHDTVHQLQSHLLEVKATQKSDSLKTCNAATSRRLYTQPKMKRILVYPNGEGVHGAVYVWGESLQQLLDNATLRLNLRRKAKYFFTVDGNVIVNFEDIDRDQIVAAAAAKIFLQPKDVRESVEIKANWGRARKKYGPRATDIEVMTMPNPRVDVDPFGPPLLATTMTGRPRQRPKSAKCHDADGVEFMNDLENDL